MESIAVAIINGVFALIMYFLARKRATRPAKGASRGQIRNRKAWQILGLLFWFSIGALFLMGASDPLLSAAGVIPIVVIPFAAIWPTAPHRAAKLVFISFAATASPRSSRRW